jgi:hypothetical protein
MRSAPSAPAEELPALAREPRPPPVEELEAEEVPVPPPIVRRPRRRGVYRARPRRGRR